MIYYVALPFTPVEGGGLAPGQAVECPHAAAAIRRAEAMFRGEANTGASVLAQRQSRRRRIRGRRDPQDLREVPDDFTCAST
jgi:hypothetical protein